MNIYVLKPVKKKKSLKALKLGTNAVKARLKALALLPVDGEDVQGAMPQKLSHTAQKAMK